LLWTIFKEAETTAGLLVVEEEGAVLRLCPWDGSG
jgi:hypothetical protein